MKTLNGKLLKEILASGANAMLNDKNRIDSLNVFPVPDGDTGSNMSSTIKYASEELEKSDLTKIGDVSALFARGMLLGARGNSGVILSQIFKGFSIPLKGKSTATLFDLTNAFEKAKEYAYKSVMKPIEGTILTVIRETSESLNEQVRPSDTIEKLFEKALIAARKSVDNTPNLLPVLKEVGVVDSGGEGLYQILRGMKEALLGKPVKLEEQTSQAEFLLSEEVYEGEFGYCTEFVADLKAPTAFSKDKFSGAIMKMGNSAVIVQDENILKVHIHTLKPGSILNFAQKFGEFIKIKVDNMSQQASKNKEATKMHVKTNDKKEEANIAVISCNVGQGIINDIKELGANFIIEGGQTMNPSAHDIINAINEVNSKQVIILPNNSNIILAAQQAAQTITDKSVIIIPTKTQMQGMAAMINFNYEGELEEVAEEMTDAINEVSTGQITLASRTTKINGVKIQEGEYLAIADKKILCSTKSKVASGIRVVDELINDDSEIVTIYYGDGATIIDAEEISSHIETNYDVQVEIKDGDQPIYNFLIAVE